MSTALVEHCIELLEPLGAVRARRMFGGHGLYLDDLFFALIAFDRLYLKADDETRARFQQAGCEPFVYDGRERPVTVATYWTVPAEAMESPAEMVPWARLALGAALRARAVKPQRRARPSTGTAPGARKAAAARAAATAASPVKPAAKRATKPASTPTRGRG